MLNYILPKLSVSNFKWGYFALSMNSIDLFLKFETPGGLADLTASAVLAGVSHRCL
jgi:hypothetical protein